MKALTKTRRRIRDVVGPKPKPDRQPNEIVTILVTRPDGRKVLTPIRRDVLVRRAMAAQVARRTMHLALNVHITDKGQPIVLDPQWEQIYADPSPDMRIIAPAQRGKTTYEIVKTLAQCSLGLAVGWVMPKHAKVIELVNGKLNPTIKNTPYYQELQEIADATDATSFKRFGPHGKLYIVTANSEDELTSFTADCMHIDERDFCNRTNLPMYPKRMNASDYKLSDEISTPTVEGSELNAGAPGNDNIHAEFLAGDQHRYFHDCEHCGERQIIDWYDNVVITRIDDSGRIMTFDVRDKDWSPGSPRDIRPCCRYPKCGRPMNRFAPGLWIPQRPGRKIRSYWTEALSTRIGPTMDTLIDTFSKSLGNPSKLQQFNNMDLGRPFSGGTLRINRKMFERCTAKGRRMVSSSEQPTTIGIDVNRPWLDYQISRWDDGKQIKVHAGRLAGGVDEVIQVLKRFRVVGGVIDHQPEAKFAMSVQEAAMAELKIPIVRCKYATNDQHKMVVVSEAGDGRLDPPRLITVHRTVAIDTIYEWHLTNQIEWFEDWTVAVDGRLFDEMSRPVRKLVINDQGNERFTWEGIPDHQLHAAVYDMLAGLVLGFDTVLDYSEIRPMMNVYTESAPKLIDPRRDDAGMMILRG